METLLLGLQPLVRWIIMSTLKASVMISLILLLRLLLRDRLASRWWHVLWAIMLLRLLCPWAPQSRLSVFNVWSPLLSTVHETAVPTAEYGIEPTVAAPRTVVSARDTKSKEYVGTVRESLHVHALNGLEMLSILWLGGVVIVTGLALISHIRLWRVVRTQRRITDPEIADIFEKCRIEMGVHTAVDLVLTDQVGAPCLFGVLRPRLLLPVGTLESLSSGKLRHVFLHEFAHLKRFDNLCGWVMLLVQILHWFNPLIWISLYRMRADRELACDTLVLSVITETDKNDYGSTILDLSAGLTRLPFVPSIAGIVESKSLLTRRIKMIAQYPAQNCKRHTWTVMLLTLFAVSILTNAQTHPVVDNLSDELRQNLLLYYSFDKDHDTQAVDTSGRDFHGRIVNAKHVSKGRVDGALAFNGWDRQIVLEEMALKEFTFVAWVKRDMDVIGNRVLLQLYNGSRSISIQAGFSVYIGADQEVSDHLVGRGAFPKGRWTHIAVTYDGRSVVVYRDGKRFCAGSALADAAVTGPVYIGGTDVWRRENAGFWQGALDEVALFNRALSVTEITWLHTQSSWGPDEALIHDDQAETIVPGVGMGRYRFGIPKDEVLDRLGEPRAIFYSDQRYSLDNLPEKYFLSYEDISFAVNNDIVRGMTALSERYRFANGIKVGDSEEAVKQVFGSDYTLEETVWKDFVIYEELGISFEINKETRTIMEINLWSRSPELRTVPEVKTTPVHNPANGHYYCRVDQRVHWHTALQLAAESTYMGLQGHLATVTSAQENQWICEHLGGRTKLRRHWLGGYLEDAQWHWITGEPFEYTHFTPGEPNGGQMEDGLEYDDEDQVSEPAHTWNDYPSRAPENGFVIEYE